MKNYWISWWNLALPDDTFVVIDTEFPSWVSGFRDDAESICAAVKANDEDAVMQIIQDLYASVGYPDNFEIRFIDERPDDWTPYNSRFQKFEGMPEWT